MFHLQNLIVFLLAVVFVTNQRPKTDQNSNLISRALVILSLLVLLLLLAFRLVMDIIIDCSRDSYELWPKHTIYGIELSEENTPDRNRSNEFEQYHRLWTCVLFNGNATDYSFFWFCRLLFCVRSVSLVNVFGLYILNGCSLRWTTMPNMWYHALWLGKINKERFLHKWNRYSIKCLLLLIESKLLCSSQHTNVFCENKNLRTKVVTVVFETEMKMVCPCFSRSIFGENCSHANEFKCLCQPFYWYTKFQFTLSESQWLLEVDGKNT